MTIDSNYNLPIAKMTSAEAAFQSVLASSFTGNIFGADYGDVSPYVPSLPELMGCNFEFAGSSQAPSQTGWFGGFNFPQLQMPDFSGLKFKFSLPSSSTSSSSSSSSLSFDRSSYSGTLSQQLVQRAMSYVGKVNSDAEGNRLFSNGASRKWCADFVTRVVKQTYGSKLPSSFGSSSVADLKEFGENNNCYINTASKSDSSKAEYIAKNVKPGDIMIEKRGGKSHTGIVTKVYSDGSFDTVEGNASDSVKTCHYTADSATLSGFVTLDKYAA